MIILATREISSFPLSYMGMKSACSAHAGLSPWEGKNALDAAVLAYSSVGLLRQQIPPTHRVHGIFGGQDWAANSPCLLSPSRASLICNFFYIVIPDKATMRYVYFYKFSFTREIHRRKVGLYAHLQPRK